MSFFIAVFFVVGGIDYLYNNRFGMGEAFEKGFHAIGQLMILMAGFIILAPVMAQVVAPALEPIAEKIGCDPSVFAGIFFGSDGGGAVLAQQMARSPEAGLYNGLIVGSFMGVSMVCTIPIVLLNVKKQYQKAATNGMMIGLLTVPLGCVLGGWFGGFSMQIILANTWPTALFICVLLVLFLARPSLILRFFCLLSIAVRGISIFGLGLAFFQESTGIVLFRGFTPLVEVFPVICNIGLSLAGILSFMALLQKLFYPLLKKISQHLNISEQAVLGPLLSLANSIPVMMELSEMDEKGCIINVAFMTSACFAVGDHLAFAMQFSPATAVALMVAKLLAGILGGALAFQWIKYREKRAK